MKLNSLMHVAIANFSDGINGDNLEGEKVKGINYAREAFSRKIYSSI